MRSVFSVIMDIVLILIATVAAFLLRQNLNVNWTQFYNLIPYLFITFIVGTVSILAFGGANSMWRYSDSGEYIRVMLVSLVTVVLTLLISFWMFRLVNVSRSLPPLQIVLISLFLISARIWARHQFVANKRTSLNSRPNKRNSVDVASLDPVDLELVLGLNTLTELYIHALAEVPGGEARIAGLLSTNPGSIGRRIGSHAVLGAPVDIARVMRELENHGIVIGRVIVTEDIHALSAEARAELSEIELSGDIKVVHLRDILMVGDGQPAQNMPEMQTDTGGSMMFVGNGQVDMALKRPYWAFKRAFDVIVSAILILTLLPLFLVVAALVFVNVGSPILFWQRRPGRFGEPFKVIKFRTMRGTFDRAGDRIPEHLRRSALGNILRSIRLDELPQLVHILRGDMSFIGPRPLLPVDQPPKMAARLMVRPGLTGWAQVHGGNLVTPADKGAMDLWYIANVSLGLEVKIVVLTIKMLIFGQAQNTDMVDIAWLGLEPPEGGQRVAIKGQNFEAPL